MRKNLLVIGFFGGGLILLLFFTIPSNPIDNKQKGVLTLTFDDGLKSQNRIAFKEMQKHSYQGTLFIVANLTGLFEGRELMNFEDAKEMQENSWEIGSHSLSHNFQDRLTKISDEELKNELGKSKEILEKEGFKIQTFAPPFGDYNNRVKEETKNYYFYVRPLKWGYNSFENIDPYNLKSKWITTKDSSDDVCSWIKKANNENLWLILNFHHIGEEKTPWDFSEQKFKEVLKCINHEGIEIKTIKEVLEDEERN